MKGFTIIELLVAIAIITVMSGAAYQGYQSFDASQKDKRVVTVVDSLIRSLDREVANDVISSYVIMFSSGSLGAVVSTNSYRLTNPLKLGAFDWNSLVGSIDMTGLTGNPGFRTVVDGKIAGTTIGSGGLATVAFNFPLWTHEKYELIGFNGTSALNNFRFELYDPESMLSSVESRPTVSFTDPSITSIVLKNFRSKKSIESQAGTPLISPALTFNRIGRTISYTLTTHD